MDVLRFCYFAFCKRSNLKFNSAGIHKLLPLSIIYAVSIPLCDMSVTYNSLGFYQISKTTIIPATILISRLLYSEKLFSGMLLYIVPIIGGAIITGYIVT
jgi:hypothetical protein